MCCVCGIYIAIYRYILNPVKPPNVRKPSGFKGGIEQVLVIIFWLLCA